MYVPSDATLASGWSLYLQFMPPERPQLCVPDVPLSPGIDVARVGVTSVVLASTAVPAASARAASSSAIGASSPPDRASIDAPPPEHAVTNKPANAKRDLPRRRARHVPRATASDHARR